MGLFASGRYSVYLLYWYKSTDTGAAGGFLASGRRDALDEAPVLVYETSSY
jgi:hypothetical protein